MAAAVFLAPRGCGFAQDCRQCGDPATRSSWGCDEETALPVASIQCFACDGSIDCDHCNGSGSIDLHRCPNQIADDRMRDILAAAGMVECGVLPQDGGWRDQAATFVEIYPLALKEIRHWQRVKFEKDKEEARRKHGTR